MALSQLTITEERSKDFLFTEPYAYLGYTLLYNMTKRDDMFLQFMRPFTMTVWGWLLFVFVISGIYFILLDIWNPFKDKIDDDSRINLKEGLWHSYLTITQIGPPFGAYMYASRVYSVFYWFFALVVMGCYTGNLCSFLTESVWNVPKISVESLPDSDWNFGMLNGTSVTAKLDERIEYDALGRFYDEVKGRENFVQDYEQGVERVKNEKFALFGSDVVLNYHYRKYWTIRS